MMTRAVVIDGYDGLEGLRVEEVAVPAPGPAEVRVAVAAAGIGPWDVFTADGAFAALLGDAEHAATFPMVLGWVLRASSRMPGRTSTLRRAREWRP